MDGMTRLEDDLRRVLRERPGPDASVVSLEAVHGGAARRRRRTVQTTLAAGATAAVLAVATFTLPWTELFPDDGQQTAAGVGVESSPVATTERPRGPDALSVTAFDGGSGVLVLARGADCAPSGRCGAALGRSTDGGRTYAPVPVPADATVRTPDGSRSGSVRGLRFSGANNGWLYGDASYRTRDGGRSWVQLTLGGPVVALEASRGRVFAVVRASEADVLLSSEAAGSAWVREHETPTAVPTPSLASSDGRAFLLSGSSLVIAGGGAPTTLGSPCADGEEGRIAVAGASIWVACRSVSGAWSLHHSRDTGTSFDRLPTVPAGLVGLDAVASRTADELFTYTSAIGFARQRLGGGTTVVTRPATSKPVRYVGFTTARVGFALPASGGVLRTDDGGATWQELSISTPDEND